MWFVGLLKNVWYFLCLPFDQTERFVSLLYYVFRDVCFFWISVRSTGYAGIIPSWINLPTSVENENYFLSVLGMSAALLGWSVKSSLSWMLSLHFSSTSLWPLMKSFWSDGFEPKFKLYYHTVAGVLQVSLNGSPSSWVVSLWHHCESIASVGGTVLWE